MTICVGSFRSRSEAARPLSLPLCRRRPSPRERMPTSISRTHAPFDMYATVQDQVYGGVDAEKPQSDSAIASTGDVVVLYNGQPITTPYHSTCGGSTASVSEVWYDQPDQPYLRSVSDKIPGTNNFYCDPSPRFSWTQSYDGAGVRAVWRSISPTIPGRRRPAWARSLTSESRDVRHRAAWPHSQYKRRAEPIHFVATTSDSC